MRGRDLLHRCLGVLQCARGFGRQWAENFRCGAVQLERGRLGRRPHVTPEAARLIGRRPRLVVLWRWHQEQRTRSSAATCERVGALETLTAEIRSASSSPSCLQARAGLKTVMFGSHDMAGRLRARATSAAAPLALCSCQSVGRAQRGRLAGRAVARAWCRGPRAEPEGRRLWFEFRVAHLSVVECGVSKPQAHSPRGARCAPRRATINRGQNCTSRLTMRL